MDEQTVRGWLKEQQDRADTLAQQQAATFQRQFDTLCRAYRRLAFLREDPERWLFAITEYFALLNTPVDQRLRIVGFNLEGAAAEWFRWMSSNGLITGWERFQESVMNRFGPSKYEDPQGALSKLLQLGTVDAYQGEFEKLMNRVTDIPETLLISFYISGLKLPLQRELLVAKPTTLGDAFALARVTEARLDDQVASMSVTAPKAVTSSGGQRQPNPRFGVSSNQEAVTKPALLPTPSQTNSNTNPKPLAIKWISPAERQERLNKGLCFNCDNKWARGHKCPGKFLLLMADDENDAEPENEPNSAEAVESGDISILNSLIGQGSPRSLQLWGSIGSGKVHVLIDNGSTHNFVRPDIVEQMQLPVQATKAFKVYIGSGESLLCENLCTQVMLSMQGLAVEVDLYVLPMKGPDVVLGIQWLQKLGKVTHDYAQQTMEFTLVNTTYTLKGDESLCMKRISLHHMQALLESDDVYGVYDLYNVTKEAEEVPTTLPPHRVIDHQIHLLPNTKPVNVRPYRYPHYQKGEMEKLVNEMLEQGIIRFSQSPFSSPVLLVKKKDGSYHFCVDYRALNEVTVKGKFPIPTADEMFDELRGAVIFTKLDLRAGYHQIRVHERDIYKTTFRTHDGHYEFLVMPFGLTNAPSTFQAIMNRLFSPYLRKFVIVFFDEILVYSTSLTAHVKHLECVFSCLQEHQFYVKKSKCAFGASTLEYLGHIISGLGVEVDSKKVAAVRDWPVPTTPRQVRGFLGLTGYYRRFIRGYATTAAPLTNLLRKGGFKWGEPEMKAFEDLKLQLSTTPVLSLPDFEKTFIVETDVADEGIGAVLLQEGRPICYFSRRLGPRMRVAATYQKELFAIVEAVFKWRHYLLGRRFIIRTDHRSIKELMQQVIQTPIQHMYVRKLLGFDFSIEYKPGVHNQVADALSRLYEDAEPLTASFMVMSQPLTEFIGELKTENRDLEELRVLHQQLDQGTAADGFRRQEGLIIFQDRYFIGEESKLKPLLLREHHDTPSSGHGGVKKMMVSLSAMFYWKGMRKSVEEYIKKCLVCQQTKYSTQSIGGYLQPLATPTAVWEDVSMDFVTGMRVAEVFVETIVKLHGIPKSIVSDHDPIFVSKFWTQLFKLSGTQLNHSTTYHPQTEVVNRGLEQYLWAMVEDRPTHWVRFLPWAEYCYNTTYHSSIKMTPYQALYGKVPYPPRSSKVATVDDALIERDALLRLLKKNLLAAKNRMEVQANRRRQDVEFAVGDKRMGKVAYRLALPADNKIHPVFHVSILKPFVGDSAQHVTNLPEEVEDGRPIEQPVAICGRRVILHKGESVQQVLVQWAGRSPEDATWEGLSEFQKAYPNYDLEDKVSFEERGNDTPMVDSGARRTRPRRTTRVSVPPVWQRDFVLLH
ncbi:ty3-gypsy retrotransposon protein [Tanacetum coccineum]